MTVKVSRSMALVVTVDTEQHGLVHVHSTPVGREVFEQFYKVMGRAWSSIMGGGQGIMSGPRVAALALRDAAEQLGVWDGEEDGVNYVKSGLLGEVTRLSNVMIQGPAGWESLPLDTAVRRGLLDADARADVEGELIFFTLAARILKRDQVGSMMEAVGGLWGSQTTSSDATSYLRSLRTSTDSASTGATATTASQPLLPT